MGVIGKWLTFAERIGNYFVGRSAQKKHELIGSIKNSWVFFASLNYGK